MSWSISTAISCRVVWGASVALAEATSPAHSRAMLARGSKSRLRCSALKCYVFQKKTEKLLAPTTMTGDSNWVDPMRLIHHRAKFSCGFQPAPGATNRQLVCGIGHGRRMDTDISGTPPSGWSVKGVGSCSRHWQPGRQNQIQGQQLEQRDALCAWEEFARDYPGLDCAR